MRFRTAILRISQLFFLSSELCWCHITTLPFPFSQRGCSHFSCSWAYTKPILSCLVSCDFIGLLTSGKKCNCCGWAWLYWAEVIFLLNWSSLAVLSFLWFFFSNKSITLFISELVLHRLQNESVLQLKHANTQKLFIWTPAVPLTWTGWCGRLTHPSLKDNLPDGSQNILQKFQTWSYV